MPPGVASALTILRVARGQPQPTEAELRAAIESDRGRLRLPPTSDLNDVAVAGPYPVTVDGQDLDEYVVWER